jgi:hypothetical protein
MVGVAGIHRWREPGDADEATIQSGMDREKFEALVAQALDGLPRTFREKLTNVAVIVEDAPPSNTPACLKRRCGAFGFSA